MALALGLVACSGGGTNPFGTGGSEPAGAGGAGGGGIGGSVGTGGAGGVEDVTFPDIATLHDLGVSRTCSLNQGVCHSSRQHPELTTADDLLKLVGMPCQLGVADPALVRDECEVPGDLLELDGKDYEILVVKVTEPSPYPPRKVTLRLASAPPSLASANARIHRVDAAKVDVLSKPLTGVTLEPGAGPSYVVLDFSGATDPNLADFMDPRAWYGDRVRMGDPNNNGYAHVSPKPWAEIYPGDPARSYLYKRLLNDKYGPQMPLIPRTWSPLATRAVWCWIKGLAPDATPDKLDINAPIDYATCPLDPDAPNPDTTGGWPEVRTLMGNKCASAQCHSSQIKAGGLDLTPNAANFKANVIDITSAQKAGAIRVVPKDPAASYLYCKADPNCSERAPNTAVMPLGQPALSDKELKTLSDWITAGAKVE